MEQSFRIILFGRNTRFLRV